ncbi:tripartite tricarboxylate transporter TctB family protein [Nocardiopsis sp. JB363]|uniref:tripartite tricarboxylate transporter TctB family protein n=1 Tax=Nocardiopsis sp. JB363 TaxID=1434837 RepID=UPI00097B9B9D|nr:tripartite tricarboxylate transporter TctB family protein [Nocardiopsis sp. JB363]SIO89130.1 Tricarboxylate transport protein TctB [Nocardiopsis sp. JB363]
MGDTTTNPDAPATSAARPGRRLRDLIPALAAAAFAVVAFVLASQVPEGARLTQFSPRWWPELLAALVLLLSVFLAVGALRRSTVTVEEDVPEEATRQGAWRLTAMLATIVGYGVLWYFIDFRVSTLLLFIALTWLGGGRGWKALILFPITVTAILYLLFGVFLRVPL